MLGSRLGSIVVAALMGIAAAVPIVINEFPSETQVQISLSDTTKSNAAAPTWAERPSQEHIKAIQEKLIKAPSWKARQKILIPDPPKADNMVYQFVNNSVEAPTGGTIHLAGVDQFPALTGVDLSMVVSFINPCGMNVPHSHPRANEFLVVTQGKLVAGFVLEDNRNGAGNVGGEIPNPVGTIPMINATLSNYKGILLPKGLTHYQFNPTCEPAVFTAGFDSSDPGRVQVAQTFLSIFPDEVPIAAVAGDLEILGPQNLERLRKKVPNSFVQLIDSCMKDCGFDY